MSYTFETLREAVDQWALDKGILESATPEKQLEKTAAELVELCIAVGRESALHKTGLLNSTRLDGTTVAVVDGIGDVLVTLIIVSNLLGVDIVDCLKLSYDEIKGRQGKMVGGLFVKEG